MKMPPPIVLHSILPAGGRRGTTGHGSKTEVLGLARSARDILFLLGRAGLDGPEATLDSSIWVEWRGAEAHRYEQS